MGNKSKHDYGRGDNVKELFKNVLEKYGKEVGEQTSGIPKEKIEQAFAIIDTHTRLLDNMTMINNYNMSIQVISTLVISHEDWSSSETRCKELINEYLNVFINFSELETADENLKKLRDNIKAYVVNSCMVYYSVFHKNKELLTRYNKETEEAIKGILKYMYINKKAMETPTNDNTQKPNNNIIPLKKDNEEENNNANL